MIDVSLVIALHNERNDEDKTIYKPFDTDPASFTFRSANTASGKFVKRTPAFADNIQRKGHPTAEN